MALSCSRRKQSTASPVFESSRRPSRLRGLRGDSSSGPFTIHLADPDDALQYLGPVSDLGQRLMKKLWPGPVGLIFDVPPSGAAGCRTPR